MPTQLSTIKTPKEKYREIVAKEISKLKSGYGLTTKELAEACGISESQFRRYGLNKGFNFEKHLNETGHLIKYYVK